MKMDIDIMRRSKVQPFVGILRLSQVRSARFYRLHVQLNQKLIIIIPFSDNNTNLSYLSINDKNYCNESKNGRKKQKKKIFFSFSLALNK